MRYMLPMLRSALSLLFLFTVLLGFVYPVLVTSIAQMIFSEKADGSLVIREGRILGSALIGQHFTEAKYFWGRPSATTPPYNASASYASNLSPGNPEQHKLIEERITMLQKRHDKKTPIPIELLTASASGLDPHISIAAVEYQIKRVAKARGMKEGEIREIMMPLVEQGVVAGDYVNVLLLNLALDEHKLAGKQAAGMAP